MDNARSAAFCLQLEEQILWGQTLSDIHCVVVQQLRLPQARPAEAQVCLLQSG